MMRLIDLLPIATGLHFTTTSKFSTSKISWAIMLAHLLWQRKKALHFLIILTNVQNIQLHLQYPNYSLTILAGCSESWQEVKWRLGYCEAPCNMLNASTRCPNSTFALLVINLQDESFAASVTLLSCSLNCCLINTQRVAVNATVYHIRRRGEYTRYVLISLCSDVARVFWFALYACPADKWCCSDESWEDVSVLLVNKKTKKTALTRGENQELVFYDAHYTSSLWNVIKIKSLKVISLIKIQHKGLIESSMQGKAPDVFWCCDHYFMQSKHKNNPINKPPRFVIKLQLQEGRAIRSDIFIKSQTLFDWWSTTAT